MTNQTNDRENEAPGQNKELNIFINGRPKEITGREITFRQVIELAFGEFSDNPDRVYTVTYKKGEGKKQEGSMVEGDVVKIKEGTIFNATQTDKS